MPGLDTRQASPPAAPHVVDTAAVSPPPTSLADSLLPPVCARLTAVQGERGPELALSHGPARECDLENARSEAGASLIAAVPLITQWRHSAEGFTAGCDALRAYIAHSKNCVFYGSLAGMTLAALAVPSLMACAAASALGPTCGWLYARLSRDPAVPAMSELKQQGEAVKAALGSLRAACAALRCRVDLDHLHPRGAYCQPQTSLFMTSLMLAYPFVPQLANRRQDVIGGYIGMLEGIANQPGLMGKPDGDNYSLATRHAWYVETVEHFIKAVGSLLQSPEKRNALNVVHALQALGEQYRELKEGNEMIITPFPPGWMS